MFARDIPPARLFFDLLAIGASEGGAGNDNAMRCFLSMDVDELFCAIYRRILDHDALGPMAELVFGAALEGDGPAHAILE